MKQLLMTAACAVALAAPAGAAEIWSVKDGCHDTSGRPCYVIHIKGEIQLEDWKQFQDVVRRDNISNALVVLDSYGGNVLGGMSIGLTIRDREFDTYVGKGATCASMCGGIWLAGHTRYAFPDSRIGFHQPSIKDKRGNKRTDPRMVSFMRDYYFKVGASKEAASFLTAAHADEMYWLNPDLAKGLDIDFVEVPLFKPEEVRTFCERSLTYDSKGTARVREDMAAAKAEEERIRIHERAIISCIDTVNEGGVDIEKKEREWLAEAQPKVSSTQLRR
jgi:hypothetical protein